MAKSSVIGPRAKKDDPRSGARMSFEDRQGRALGRGHPRREAAEGGPQYGLGHLRRLVLALAPHRVHETGQIVEKERAECRTEPNTTAPPQTKRTAALGSGTGTISKVKNS
jgi:hypothetical protein